MLNVIYKWRKEAIDPKGPNLKTTKETTIDLLAHKKLQKESQNTKNNKVRI